MSVPPAVADGSTIRIQHQQQYRILITDPPATAGGTDIYPGYLACFALSINSTKRGSSRNEAQFGSFSKHGRFELPSDIERSSHSNASPCKPSSAYTEPI